MNSPRRVFIILGSFMAISCLEVEKVLVVNLFPKLLKAKAVTYSQVTASPSRMKEVWACAHCGRERN